ncbi:MAG TPA: inositol monophosphatase family protein [Thermoanaerobaculia bacterium]|nr:inositol monophosphatase family protein [Thermoanaerobaculia bacterium]
MTPDLELALSLADAADELTLRHFGSASLAVRTKADRTPVSEADEAVERLLRSRVPSGDAVLGEEFGGSTPHPPFGHLLPAGRGEGSRGKSPSPRASGERVAEGRVRGVRTWIIDPIDATKNYIRGIPVFATLIALSVDDVLQVGVVSAPALARRWFAARGLGAFCNGTRLRVSSVASLSDAQLAYDGIADFDKAGLSDRFLTLARSCYRTRGFGDFWAHMLVAEGAMDVAVEPEVAPWDVAAVQLIVEEAGGRFTDLGGKARHDGGSALSTNGMLHDAVRVILSRADGEGSVPISSGA